MDSVAAEAEGMDKLKGEAAAARDAYARTQFLLEARQTRLLAELQSIYPLQLLPNREWAIRGLELPREMLSKDDEHVSSALGYTAHLVLMLSKYLGVPLRYQILFYSSRSAIRDEVRDGANASNNTYYLFRRGVERERFESAVLMLQKNCDQLLAARGVPYAPELSMLANLQNLFVHEMDPRVV
uniref:Uncharacterized protein n=1 Tax=Phaeomonas parva TaxID=124430 RepID=A0A7S1XLF7_9STRA|mmetsp:Transcript_18984/g.57669  ORF Transcript_18984/g.57669 Transcript_18984/m.57669 type:complete len:184 (+) Transcript_18984:56-607(+)